MDVENDHPSPDDTAGELESRPPTEEDLVGLCRRLNELGAQYIVIGGFAIIEAGLPRMTMDVDLLIESSLRNEALVYEALESLPDKAVRELKPGEGRWCSDPIRLATVTLADEGADPSGKGQRRPGVFA